MNSLIDLTSGKTGYSIIKCPEIRTGFEFLILEHLNELFKVNFDSVLQFLEPAKIDSYFELLKVKKNRIFSQSNSLKALQILNSNNLLRLLDPSFITDEECLGYPNIYWRCVRANINDDVGSVHADEWFWALGHGSTPPNYTRVKVWIPIIQDDDNPSLLILPASHLEYFDYEYVEDSSGKKRPVFNNSEIIDRMIPAPVKNGECIVFNDRLLHGGRSTKLTRLSVEMTYCFRNSV